jgi:hypothetical protein
MGSSAVRLSTPAVWLSILVPPLVAVLLLPGGSRAQPARGKKHALVVGVRYYESSKFDPLLYTENDAEDLARVLSEQGGFAVRVLTTSRGSKRRADAPTAARLRAEIKALLAGKTRHDTVLVALAGHGMQGRVTERGAERDESFFCPCDAQFNDNGTLLPLGKLFADLDGCGAGVKLLLVDGCRNDPTIGRNVNVDHLRPPRGIAALFSCKSGERAFESPKLGRGHGVFFHHVIEGLKGEAKNKRGEVTWITLADYVIDKVSDDVPRLIRGGAKQTPELKVNLTGKSPVLVRLTASAAGPRRPAAEPVDRTNPLVALVVGQNGDAIYGGGSSPNKDLYYGRVSKGARLELVQEKIHRDKSAVQVKVKVLSNQWSSEVGKVGWVSMCVTNFKKSGSKVVGVLSDKARPPEGVKHLTGLVTHQFGDPIHGDATSYDKDDYLGRVSKGARLELWDDTVRQNQFGSDIIQVKVLSNPRSSDAVGLIGWVTVGSTNFKTAGGKVIDTD